MGTKLQGSEAIPSRSVRAARIWLVGWLLDLLLRGLTSVRRHRRVAAGGALVNLGSGVLVAPGWINIDNGAHLLVRRLPLPLLRLILRATDVGPAAAAPLKSGHFLFHNLTDGIPLEDGAAQCIYSAHFFEHITRDDAERLLRDAFRVLQPGGVIRITVPSADHNDGGGQRYFDRHRSSYTPGALLEMLGGVGFTDLRERTYRVGDVPDLDIIEVRPDGCVFVEGVRP